MTDEDAALVERLESFSRSEVNNPNEPAREYLQGLVAEVRALIERLSQHPLSGKRLWLWRNFVDGRPEYWAFDNPFPCYPGPGDPMTLGEPCGWALFKQSENGRPDKAIAEVEAAIKHPLSTDEGLAPIPMILFCPKCGLQHIDKPDPDDDWNNPPHTSHKCVGPNGCGCVWRPADVPTNGVAAIETRGSKDTVFYNRAASAAPDEGLRKKVARAIAERMERSHDGYDLADAALTAIDTARPPATDEWLVEMEDLPRLVELQRTAAPDCPEEEAWNRALDRAAEMIRAAIDTARRG